MISIILVRVVCGCVQKSNLFCLFGTILKNILSLIEPEVKRIKCYFDVCSSRCPPNNLQNFGCDLMPNCQEMWIQAAISKAATKDIQAL